MAAMSSEWLLHIVPHLPKPIMKMIFSEEYQTDSTTAVHVEVRKVGVVSNPDEYKRK
jgi:hypothetical protein